MDAEEVKDEGGDGQEGRQLAIFDGGVIALGKRVHGLGDELGGDGGEADAALAVGSDFDDVVVAGFPLAGITGGATLGDGVQALDEGGGDDGGLLAQEDGGEGGAVAGELFFGAIARPGLADDEGAETVGVDGDAFDAIGGFDALDGGLFAEDFEEFGLLADPEILFAAHFHAGGEEPAGAHGERGEEELGVMEGEQV